MNAKTIAEKIQDAERDCLAQAGQCLEKGEKELYAALMGLAGLLASIRELLEETDLGDSAFIMENLSQRARLAVRRQRILESPRMEMMERSWPALMADEISPLMTLLYMMQSPGYGSPRRSPGYPRFMRTPDGELAKIGLSKSGKEEYQQRAPFALLESVTAKIAMVPEGELFKVEQLLEPGGEAAAPEYQVYLCVAWLRQEGLLTKHGHKGYSAVPEFSLAWLERWRRLEVME